MLSDAAREDVVRYVVNAEFNAAALYFSDGSFLQFEHTGRQNRWARPSADDTRAGAVCRSLAQFRLNAKHLQLFFTDGSNVEYFQRTLDKDMIEHFVGELQRYKAMGEKALGQVSDAALNRIPVKDGNSIGMIVRHISGNLTSRFTDFLTTDGEKPWRKRDDEFEERYYSRSDVESMWKAGWDVVTRELAAVKDADMDKTVTIRGVPFSVHEALSRLVSHVAYHVGQIVVLARMAAEGEWHWITIPKGQSESYNQNPTKEKRLT